MFSWTPLLLVIPRFLLSLVYSFCLLANVSSHSFTLVLFFISRPTGVIVFCFCSIAFSWYLLSVINFKVLSHHLCFNPQATKNHFFVFWSADRSRRWRSFYYTISLRHFVVINLEGDYLKQKMSLGSDTSMDTLKIRF